ncbi:MULTISPECIES: DNA cytosine methyltransferase [unclassified Mesorhizobium]|uniref:DNA cytosine methyltransferase n=1 Tax=unclassified Mesorhizobium TaxID=325217 RepID=UPI001CD1311B|nr:MULTISPECIES: DNA cytosine methyltransferase [unclassified Mesorhizobium]MCA0025489.1 DNA cytosine methyltransferase [Mesorhizobium sp. B263B1A]
MTVVLFAGLGGGCDGLEAAGFPVHVAINHDPVAVAIHKARHPHTRHLQCDVFEADPREVCKGRGVRVLHASPDCTHFSVAKGGKPVSKRRRSLAWVVCRWAGTVRPETITMENVSEIQTWGPLVAKRDPATGRVLRLDGSIAAKGERVPVEQQWLIPDPRHKGRIWRAWLNHLRGLGYSFDHRILTCADYGVPTIRKRFFGVAQADGRPIAWRERTHAPRDKARKLKLRPWVGMHTCIDWSIPVRSIFGRAKDLAAATLRRTARGLVRHVAAAAKPFIVPITHSGDDRVHSIDDPARTFTTAHRGEMSLIVPSFGVMRNSREPTYAGNDPAHAFTAGGANHALIETCLVPFTAGAGGRAAQSGERGIAEPAGSQTTKEDRVLVAANLIRTDQHSAAARNGVHDLSEPVNTLHTSSSMAMVAATMIQSGYGERQGQSPRVLDIEEPAGTQVAGGSKAAVVAAFMAQHSAGTHPGQPSRDMNDPLSTITTVGSQQGLVAASMLALRGTNRDGRDIGEPAATICASGNHAGLILAFLQHYYSNGKTDDDITSPLGALTAKARHGLVTVTVRGVDYVITDVGMRMVEPEEGAAAHGFKPGCLDHEITVYDERKRRMVTRKLNKTEKYHLVGNSVPPFMVQMLAEDNVRRELVLEAAE